MEMAEKRLCNSSGKSVWGLVKWNSNPSEYLLSLEKLLDLCLNFLPCKMDILLFSSSSYYEGIHKKHFTQCSEYKNQIKGSHFLQGKWWGKTKIRESGR